jgi:hypothetical protein
VWAIWEYIIVPVVYIKAPTKRIIELIKSGDRLVVIDPASDPKKYANDHFETNHAVIRDIVSKKETIVFSYCMKSSEMSLRGDLDWMNAYEQEAVGDVAYRIIKKRWNKYKEACVIEEGASDDRRRAAAKHTY